MTWAGLAEAIRSRAITDTGSGGLFQTGSPLLTAWYTTEAPEQTTTADTLYPYVLVTHVSDTETKVFQTGTYVETHGLDFHIYCHKKQGLTIPDTICLAIRTRFDRWAPTVSGYTVFQMMRQDGQKFIDEDTHHWIESYEVVVTKG